MFMVPSIAYADLSCVEEAPNTEQGKDIGGFEDKEGLRSSMTEAVQNPAMDLLFCSMQIDFQPAASIKKKCGCLQAIEELCSYDVKDFDISAGGGASRAMCAPFAPWAL